LNTEQTTPECNLITCTFCVTEPDCFAVSSFLWTRMGIADWVASQLPVLHSSIFSTCFAVSCGAATL